MKEFRWIRINDGYESFRQYAQTLPSFNHSFGEREAFTYTVRDIPASEWNEIVRDRRLDRYPGYHEFLRAYFAKEVLSQPIHMIRLMQQIGQAHQDEPLSNVTGI